ncbi:MAG: hypothetical protein K2R98_07240 [Gemmataceae bacterium]|nr:hypothetical protein [Gemmataceae bacterium]
MPGKGCAKWLALLSVMTLAGCCSWCDKHCPNCRQAALAPAPQQCCQPCCYPAAAPAPVPQAVGYAPAPPPPPGGTWQRNYTCTCQGN